MAQAKRMYQIAEKVRHVLATEILSLGDPRLSLITITSVSVTSDLRLAKIYWMASGVLADGTDRRSMVQDALHDSTALLKRLLAKKLGIKFVPELKFYYDDSLDTREEVERLLQKARAKSEPVNE